MCKPVIAQSGSADGLALICREHRTTEPVLDANGVLKHSVDVLQHIDMLSAHRAKYDKPTWEEWASKE